MKSAFDLRRRADDHGDQICIYTDAIREVTGETAAAGEIHYTQFGTPREIPLSELMMEHTRQDFRAAWDRPQTSGLSVSSVKVRLAPRSLRQHTKTPAIAIAISVPVAAECVWASSALHTWTCSGLFIFLAIISGVTALFATAAV